MMNGFYDFEPPSNEMGVHETRCKHGSTSCTLCGTSQRRDFVHVTKGGRGAVAKVFKKGCRK